MKECINCNKKLRGHSKFSKRCPSCAAKQKIGIKNSRYIDGRTNTKYYCLKCGKIISYQTYCYGTKRCKKCFQLGKLNPRYGKHWSKKQKDNRVKSLHKHHIDCNHYNEEKINITYLTQSGHMRAHGSLNKLVAFLMKINIVYFDIKKGIYKIRKLHE